MIFLIFIILFVLFLFGLFSIAEGQPDRVSPVERRSPVRTPKRSAPQPRSRVRSPGRGNMAARYAMQRAKYPTDDAYVTVSDIGLLAYQGEDDPQLVRYNDVWDDTDYLRPFVVLSVPYQARGMVRLAIEDQDGRLRYADETRYDLQVGENTLLPRTWLPLRNRETSTGHWALHVMVGDTLLAVHKFGWREVGGNIKHYIEADGEISPELQQALRESSSQAMSLSQLLSDQDD